jgi:putative hydroxymethylpyrimidine transport system substrate-binding protein
MERGRTSRLGAILCAIVAGTLPAACGSSPSSPSPAQPAKVAIGTGLAKPTNVTLVLDFIPNAVHVGIYRAIAAGYYKSKNIDLRVIQPASTADTLKLIDAGKAQFGLADGIDVASQIDAGRDAEAIMAVVQEPLGALIALASEHVATACQLLGKTVGITGVPSDTAVVDTTIRHAGCDPTKLQLVTIGFGGVQDMVAHRLAAFTGFWPADGVQLQANGYPITTFKLEQNGGPAYPGLVAFTTKSLIRSNPQLVRGFLAATVEGYEDAARDPQRALADLLRLNPALARKFTEASLKAYLPLFTDNGSVRFGELENDKLAALSRWLVQYRLIRKPISPSRFGTNRFLPSRR